MTQPSKNRIEIIDALRGFSLAGIVIAHFVENYIAAPPPQELTDGIHTGILDDIVDGIIFIFIRGKFFALFSFLFGLSFFIQMDRGAKKSNNFQIRFLWRIIILLAIGFLHHLFYRGDILTIYAIVGIFLIPFYRLPTKWLIAIISFVFLGGFRYVIFAITGGDQLFNTINMTSPDSKELLEYYDILKNGSLWDVFKTNTLQGHLMKLDFQFGIFSRGYITFGFFLAGLLFGRLGFFEGLEKFRKMNKKIVIWSIVGFVLSFVLTGVLFSLGGNNGQTPDFNSWINMFALSFYDISNVAMTFLLIALFVILWKKSKAGRFLKRFAPYGRMALSNYIIQTLIGTFILYGWGLGYIGSIPNTYIFLISILLIVIQMIVSKWWLKKFFYGPLEWVWRSLTYFKNYPLKKG